MLNSIPSIFIPTSFDSAKTVVRKLSDLGNCFADHYAYERELKIHDPVVYRVSGIEPANGNGDLHYGLGTIMPGRIGREFYLTKGHYHSWREAAEVYIGLAGQGMMLLQDEQTGESKMLPLQANSVVYVPGNTAHRTVNCGQVPLVYIGVYPALAGHDYASLTERNFNQVIALVDDKPQMILRSTYLNRYLSKHGQ